MQFVPLTAAPRQQLGTRLGEARYDLRVWWQSLTEAWYLSVYREAAPIALSRQVAVRQRLTYPHEMAGAITVVQLAPAVEVVGRNAWGVTHALVYLDPGEAEVLFA